MVSKCANPDCLAPFHYLREGKLFQFDRQAVAGPQLVRDKPLQNKIEYFWLCGRCASSMTLEFARGKGVVAVPLETLSARRAMAS